MRRGLVTSGDGLIREPLNNLLRGAIASSRGARNLAYLFDMSRLLRAVLLALTPLATVLQRFLRQDILKSPHDWETAQS